MGQWCLPPDDLRGPVPHGQEGTVPVEDTFGCVESPFGHIQYFWSSQNFARVYFHLLNSRHLPLPLCSKVGKYSDKEMKVTNFWWLASLSETVWVASGPGCLWSPKFQNLETLSSLSWENRNSFSFTGKYQHNFLPNTYILLSLRYHHVTVLIYCWYSFSEYTAPARWFVVMNFIVHSLMYSYYFLKASRCEGNRLWN